MSADVGSIFPSDNDHNFHLVRGVPYYNCEACKQLPRHPIKKVGYIWQEPNGEWRYAGWEFDTSVPGTYIWLVQDIIDFAQQQAQIMSLGECAEPNP
jgi:hypothetical protein